MPLPFFVDAVCPASADIWYDSCLASQAVRTTADPRPNAYIPDELGIPKPYGGLAPFKPTELGSSMRHIKAPKPPEIQI